MASVRKRPNGSYEVRVYVGKRLTADGREVSDYRSATFPTKTAALNHAKTVGADRLRGTWVDPKRGRRNFAAFAEGWAAAMLERPDLARNTKRAYLYAYEAQLLPYFAEHRMAEVTRAEVRAWVRWATKRWGAAAVNNAFATLRLIFDAAVEAEVVAASPCVKPGLPRTAKKAMTPLTAAQLATLGTQAALVRREYNRASSAHALREGLDGSEMAVWLAGRCGLRAGEVWGLHAASVDLAGGWLHVDWHLADYAGTLRMEAAAKGGKVRRVPLRGEVRDRLASYLAAHPPRRVVVPTGERGSAAHELVFVNHDGDGAVRHANWYRRQYVPAVERLAGADAAFPVIDFHDLRHTAVSLWLDEGVRIDSISRWLGHASVTFTERTYARWLPSTDEREAALLDRQPERPRRLRRVK